MMYRQCKLVNGNVRTVSWIPVQFAKLGMVLKLKVRGQWHDGWKVEEAWTEQEDPLDHRDLITTFKISK